MRIKYILLSLCLFAAAIIKAQEVIDPGSLPPVVDFTVVLSNPDADTVIIALQGGPTSILSTGGWDFLRGIPTFSVVEVYKHEMLTPVLNNDSLSFDEAVAVNDTTAALIEKGVQYYKDQDKVVVLIGHSWGAILLGEYLDDYGNENIHRIIPMEGRLSMPPEFTAYLLDGYLPTFDNDGISLLFETPQYHYQHGLLTLAAAAFDNRWTDSLASLDLSNMMYTYSTNDQNTGALIQEETDFLNASGAQTLTNLGGFHGSSFLVMNQLKILDFIREDIASSISLPNLVNNDLILYPTLAISSISIKSKNKGDLSIYDIMGRPILQEIDLELNLNVDVSSFANGHYIAVHQKENGQVSIGRFQVIK